MNHDTLALSKDELQLLLAKGDDDIQSLLDNISHAADINEFFRQVDIDQWPRLLRLIRNPEQRAAVVSNFDRGEWNDLLPLLSPKEIAEVVQALDTDDAADLLADMPLSERSDALQMLNSQEQAQVQQLLRYPQDSAGGIMQLELATVSDDATVLDAIKLVRKRVENDEEVLLVLVLDKRKHLVGSLALVDLLLNKETTLVSSIMDPNVVVVKPLLDQEKVAAIFKKYDLICVPVVDDNRRVLGQIVIDDVVDVLAEEAEEDVLHMAGTSSEELLHKDEVMATVRVRLPWLGIALSCSLISGLMLHIFSSTVKSAVIILSFIPVITAMGGNVGTQSATVLIRGFATGKFDLSSVPKFLYKEIRVGLLMGVIYGICAGLVGTFLLTDHNFYLGIVVFFAMSCAMMTAAILGVTAPTILKRLNIDPAIASGPFVTTLNDISGIVIYMLIASIFLAKLEIG